MGEIIFNKSRKNLKKIYNRINSTNLNKFIRIKDDDVLYLAMGGYNRTYELLIAMGLKPNEIVTFSNLTLSRTFLEETNGKQVVLLQKINYTTSVVRGNEFTKKKLDLNVADGFEESMMIYSKASRMVQIRNGKELWAKPPIVILDDQSLNLQFEGHRFKYQNKIGFVQVRNRNTDPYKIVLEIEDVDEADAMMFAMYQDNGVDEAEVLNAIGLLRTAVFRKIDNDWYLKPTEFKKIVGSQQLFNKMKQMPELGIHQLSANKKIGKDNARWIVLPETAFDFTGYDYLDEDELFDKELAEEQSAEDKFAEEQDRRLRNVLTEELQINIKIGFVGNEMNPSKNETLENFLADVDEVEQENEGISLLTDATTDEEYKYIKKNHLVYFLDGNYKNDERLDENYLGGKRLISIDIDDGDYTREQIEDKLQQQGFFGLVYRTAKYYFDESNRWRIVLMADQEMSKSEYKNVVTGVAQMLDLEIDNASKKISQLMGYPLASKDLSTVIGSLVNVKQFTQPELTKQAQPGKVVGLDAARGTRSIADFNHAQARLLKSVLTHGAPEGQRNETYRQVYMYLNDTLNNPEMARYHDEARELLQITKQQALSDGLPEKEVEVIYR